MKRERIGREGEGKGKHRKCREEEGSGNEAGKNGKRGKKGET